MRQILRLGSLLLTLACVSCFQINEHSNAGSPASQSEDANRSKGIAAQTNSDAVVVEYLGVNASDESWSDATPITNARMRITNSTQKAISIVAETTVSGPSLSFPDVVFLHEVEGDWIDAFPVMAEVDAPYARSIIVPPLESLDFVVPLFPEMLNSSGPKKSWKICIAVVSKEATSSSCTGEVSIVSD